MSGPGDHRPHNAPHPFSRITCIHGCIPACTEMPRPFWGICNTSANPRKRGVYQGNWWTAHSNNEVSGWHLTPFLLFGSRTSPHWENLSEHRQMCIQNLSRPSAGFSHPPTITMGSRRALVVMSCFGTSDALRSFSRKTAQRAHAFSGLSRACSERVGSATTIASRAACSGLVNLIMWEKGSAGSLP